ncbi:MAG: type II toxin-antitoxin system VapC family toxin [Coriobacteriia bacterium]
MSSELVVLDASVGVKWFSPEDGHEQAIDILASAAAGGVRIVVPDLFVYEVVRTVRRKAGPAHAREVVRFFALSGIISVPPGERVLAAALEHADSLGCDVYDACAPAIASLLDATLYSADRKAHSQYPGVVLVG